ncbi:MULTISPECIES: SDR family NAD(P)-dependent oxidoreductase [Sodalis]|uniref:NAD(P)-dependent dehydrogenase (Short-subunit alcohol dehydrogenase family) n=1 Tax=Sodalis ligni TaxID=2697027 RepID=A0A4R1N6J4_9GAMM|nr:SDR family oxidoreductase [Sodalis ligni]TCL02129.1 NAD(P)-dependent dehydrogenase (short-subunit alcohol dehydrogenase family) [Sodalis ligni]
MSEHLYTQYQSLAGKTVLITGGASGIGADLVAAFSQQHSRVHFLDINTVAGEALSAVHGAVFHYCDLRDIPALRTVIGDIAAREGGIDVLINNAADDDRHDMFAVEPEYWRNRMAVNLDHQFFATQAVAIPMRERQSGAIILTSSTSVMKGRPGMVGYTTAKAAILGLNRTLTRELGPFGIRVNCIVPGAISTPRQQALWRTPLVQQEIMDMQAIKIDLQGSDIAAMALFVASDDARGCTGAQFVVDAGIRLN